MARSIHRTSESFPVAAQWLPSVYASRVRMHESAAEYAEPVARRLERVDRMRARFASLHASLVGMHERAWENAELIATTAEPVVQTLARSGGVYASLVGIAQSFGEPSKCFPTAPQSRRFAAEAAIRAPAICQADADGRDIAPPL
jgi:hypothetical protein